MLEDPQPEQFRRALQREEDELEEEHTNDGLWLKMYGGSERQRHQATNGRKANALQRWLWGGSPTMAPPPPALEERSGGRVVRH
ncbi:hypothetical protein HaLaN_28912, partial [Haematococcus lacustris]